MGRFRGPFFGKRLVLPADPRIKCPETGEKIMPTECRHCQLYQDWGNEGMELCRYEYEELKAARAESEEAQQKAKEESEQFIEWLGEEKERLESRGEEIRRYLEERDEHEIQLRASIRKVQEELKRELDKQPDLEDEEEPDEPDYEEDEDSLDKGVGWGEEE
jgi:hypothetical protein